MTDIQIEGLDAVLRKLGKVEHLERELGPPMEASLAYVRRRMEKAPRKAKGAFSALATPAQKRAYWARVRNEPGMHGANGYIRGSSGGGTVAKAWYTRVEKTGKGLIGEVGNNRDYARYVYSEDQQQLFHYASGWPIAERELDKAAPYIEAQFRKTIQRILKG